MCKRGHCGTSPGFQSFFTRVYCYKLRNCLPNGCANFEIYHVLGTRSFAATRSKRSYSVDPDQVDFGTAAAEGTHAHPVVWEMQISPCFLIVWHAARGRPDPCFGNSPERAHARSKNHADNKGEVSLLYIRREDLYTHPSPHVRTWSRTNRIGGRMFLFPRSNKYATRAGASCARPDAVFVLGEALRRARQSRIAQWCGATV